MSAQPYPPTRILRGTPLPATEATAFLQSFIHWTSATRPIRNRQVPFNTVPVHPFPPSVLTNLKRVEMGLRGEQAPRISISISIGIGTRPPPGTKPKPKPGPNDKHKTKRKRTEMEEGEAEGEDGRRNEQMEVQAGAREMRADGDVVDRAPTVLALAAAEDGAPMQRDKARRKEDKKARRKAEKKAREEKRRKSE